MFGALFFRHNECTCSHGMPVVSETADLLKRFNPQLVGFGILGLRKADAAPDAPVSQADHGDGEEGEPYEGTSDR